ncbi:CatB-related O-acetyltransferase [Pseudaestuariivita sp.]|uniref:CatB-related O-acetyltransferase n=1 Tax=Pseudaestuariivita sp. TaxID=2211669 RepID=UPI00405A364B
MPLPSPDAPHPIILPDGTRVPSTVQLSAVTNHPNFEVGAWTYASAFDPPQDWVARLAPYLFPNVPDKVRIGKFCQIADGVKFISAAANHWMTGVSTYPFPILDMTRHLPPPPDNRDITLGHDVWLGNGAMVLAGSTIGNGAIIGAGAVVRGDVPDYAIVIGNPAQVIRMRFTPEEIETLNTLAWWDWPAEAIEAAQPALVTGSVADLQACAP